MILRLSRQRERLAGALVILKGSLEHVRACSAAEHSEVTRSRKAGIDADLSADKLRHNCQTLILRRSPFGSYPAVGKAKEALRKFPNIGHPGAEKYFCSPVGPFPP